MEIRLILKQKTLKVRSPANAGKNDSKVDLTSFSIFL